jgi:CDP-paratose 2-epimerase
MTHLITGGCGFLGSNLAAAALKKGLDLVIFDNLSRPGTEKNLEWLRSLGKFTHVNADIRGDEINKTVKEVKPDVIFHLAGQVTMTLSLENPRHDFETNALGTINLLEAVRAHSPHAAVVYSSTNKVYGDLEHFEYEETPTRYVLKSYPNGFSESLPLEFCSPYGCSKGAADQYMLDYARIYGLNTVVFRHSTMFGTRQFSNYDQGWIGWFVGQAIDKLQNPDIELFTVCGNGKQVRDILFSEDIINVYYAAAEKMSSVRGQVFNIGGGFDNSLSILELLSFLETKLNVKLNFRPIPVRQSDQKVFIADIRKAQEKLAWNPAITKTEGVTRMVDWVQEAKQVLDYV